MPLSFDGVGMYVSQPLAAMGEVVEDEFARRKISFISICVRRFIRDALLLLGLEIVRRRVLRRYALRLLGLE